MKGNDLFLTKETWRSRLTAIKKTKNKQQKIEKEKSEEFWKEMDSIFIQKINMIRPIPNKASYTYILYTYSVVLKESSPFNLLILTLIYDVIFLNFELCRVIFRELIYTPKPNDVIWVCCQPALV